MQIRRFVPAALVAALAGTASADFTFPLFNLNVGNPITSIDLNGAIVPAGTYLSYEVAFDWTAGPGDPWSDEAIWAFVDRPAGDFTGTFYADPGVSNDAAGNGNPVRLTWSGLLDAPYNGGDPLFFWQRQTFPGSFADWSNISITLKTSGAPQPSAIDLGTLSAGMTMATGNLSAGQVVWYKFTVGDVIGPGSFLTADTLGSSLSSTDPFDFPNDTEIGLYSSTGTLLASNDDIDFSGGNYLSSVGFGGAVDSFGDLAAGTYFIAIGGFNTTFGGGFNVTSTSLQTGTYKLNINTNVPTPGVMAFAGLVGLAAARRRRQA